VKIPFYYHGLMHELYRSKFQKYQNIPKTLLLIDISVLQLKNPEVFKVLTNYWDVPGLSGATHMNYVQRKFLTYIIYPHEGVSYTENGPMPRFPFKSIRIWIQKRFLKRESCCICYTSDLGDGANMHGCSKCFSVVCEVCTRSLIKNNERKLSVPCPVCRSIITFRGIRPN